MKAFSNSELLLLQPVLLKNVEFIPVKMWGSRYWAHLAQTRQLAINLAFFSWLDCTAGWMSMYFFSCAKLLRSCLSRFPELYCHEYKSKCQGQSQFSQVNNSVSRCIRSCVTVYTSDSLEDFNFFFFLLYQRWIGLSFIMVSCSL